MEEKNNIAPVITLDNVTSAVLSEVWNLSYSSRPAEERIQLAKSLIDLITNIWDKAKRDAERRTAEADDTEGGKE